MALILFLKNDFPLRFSFGNLQIFLKFKILVDFSPKPRKILPLILNFYTKDFQKPRRFHYSFSKVASDHQQFANNLWKSRKTLQIFIDFCSKILANSLSLMLPHRAPVCCIFLNVEPIFLRYTRDFQKIMKNAKL